MGIWEKKRESEICFHCRNNYDFFSVFWACCWKVWGIIDPFLACIYAHREMNTRCLHFLQERLICVWSMNVWVNNEVGHVLSVREGFVFLLCKAQKLPWLSCHEWQLAPVVSGVMRTEQLASNYAYVVMHTWFLWQNSGMLFFCVGRALCFCFVN